MLALTEKGELYGWGSGTYGECGQGDYVDTNIPVRVNSQSLDQIVDFQCGGFNHFINYLLQVIIHFI